MDKKLIGTAAVIGVVAGYMYSKDVFNSATFSAEIDRKCVNGEYNTMPAKKKNGIKFSKITLDGSKKGSSDNSKRWYNVTNYIHRTTGSQGTRDDKISVTSYQGIQKAMKYAKKWKYTPNLIFIHDVTGDYCYQEEKPSNQDEEVRCDKEGYETNALEGYTGTVRVIKLTPNPTGPYVDSPYAVTLSNSGKGLGNFSSLASAKKQKSGYPWSDRTVAPYSANCPATATVVPDTSGDEEGTAVTSSGSTDWCAIKAKYPARLKEIKGEIAEERLKIKKDLTAAVDKATKDSKELSAKLEKDGAAELKRIKDRYAESKKNCSAKEEVQKKLKDTDIGEGFWEKLLAYLNA